MCMYVHAWLTDLSCPESPSSNGLSSTGIVLLSPAQLRRASKLSDVVRCALLPSADMVVSLSMEFGVPATFNDLACESVCDSGGVKQHVCVW